MRLFEWLHFVQSKCHFVWSKFLPDKCEMPGCRRKGIRGNENIVHGLIMCDDCHARLNDEFPIDEGVKQ